MTRRIYVASSWRNEYQPMVVDELRQRGHQVFDFRHPDDGTGGFHWNDIDEDWKLWTMEKYRSILLNEPLAAKGFMRDYRAMQWADTCVLVLPSGPSSHLEAGYFNGANKQLVVYCPAGVTVEPDLMYLMAQHICLCLPEILEAFG